MKQITLYAVLLLKLASTCGATDAARSEAPSATQQSRSYATEKYTDTFEEEKPRRSLLVRMGSALRRQLGWRYWKRNLILTTIATAAVIAFLRKKPVSPRHDKEQHWRRVVDTDIGYALARMGPNGKTIRTSKRHDAWKKELTSLMPQALSLGLGASWAEEDERKGLPAADINKRNAHFDDACRDRDLVVPDLPTLRYALVQDPTLAAAGADKAYSSQDWQTIFDGNQKALAAVIQKMRAFSLVKEFHEGKRYFGREKNEERFPYERDKQVLLCATPPGGREYEGYTDDGRSQSGISYQGIMEGRRLLTKELQNMTNVELAARIPRRMGHIAEAAPPSFASRLKVDVHAPPARESERPAVKGQFNSEVHH
jgi:hypothetical protein